MHDDASLDRSDVSSADEYDSDSDVGDVSVRASSCYPPSTARDVRSRRVLGCMPCVRGWFLFQGLSVNQKRLLYMLSLYTHPAETEDDKERWIRQQALMVLIYEGVVARVFDYDYAPSSEIIEGRRNWFNMSQVTTVVDTVGCALVQLPH